MHAVTLDAPRSVGTAAPSFASVAEELLDDVYGYLLYLTKNWAVAEDLTSETFEAAFKVAALRPAPWNTAGLVARNRAHDRARLVSRRCPETKA
jgi:DNA-directed RNA polymerase specialized sigma24 family protein